MDKTNEQELYELIDEEFGLTDEIISIEDLGVTLEGLPVTHMVCTEVPPLYRSEVQLWSGDPTARHSECWRSKNFKRGDNRFEDACAQIVKLY